MSGRAEALPAPATVLTSPENAIAVNAIWILVMNAGRWHCRGDYERVNDERARAGECGGESASKFDALLC